MGRTVRIAVLADIHGNLPALEVVLGDLRAQGVAGVAAAGDLTSGVWSGEAVARILERSQWAVAGNHEEYYVALEQGIAPVEWISSPQWQAMRWCYEHLPREALDQVKTLPQQTVIEVDGAPPIRLFHGSPHSSREHLFPDRQPEALRHFRAAGLLGAEPPTRLDSRLEDVAESVVVCGHSHIPWVQRSGGRLVVNAGAVGGAINGDVRAQYALLEWDGAGSGGWQATHRTLDYDIPSVREAFEHSGYLAEGGAFAYAILRNIETGRNVPGALLRHVDQVARAAGYLERPVPDALWLEAADSFDWGE